MRRLWAVWIAPNKVIFRAARRFRANLAGCVGKTPNSSSCAASSNASQPDFSFKRAGWAGIGLNMITSRINSVLDYESMRAVHRLMIVLLRYCAEGTYMLPMPCCLCLALRHRRIVLTSAVSFCQTIDCLRQLRSQDSFKGRRGSDLGRRSFLGVDPSPGRWRPFRRLSPLIVAAQTQSFAEQNVRPMSEDFEGGAVERYGCERFEQLYTTYVWGEPCDCRQVRIVFYTNR